MLRRAILFFIAAIVLFPATVSADSDKLQPVVVRQMGGSFTHLNVVGGYVFVVEGDHNIVVYPANKLGGFTIDYIAKHRFDIDAYIYDMVTVEADDGTVELFLISSYKRAKQLEKWLFDGSKLTFVTSRSTTHTYMNIGSEYVFTTGNDVRMYDHNLHLLSTYTNESPTTYANLDFYEGKLYVPYSRYVDVIDVNTMQRVDRFDVAGVYEISVDGDLILLQRFANMGNSITVYNRHTHERVFLLPETPRLRVKYEPELSARLYGNHVVIPDGFFGVKIWDIETERWLVGGENTTDQGGEYPFEVVKVGMTLYVNDYFFGIHTMKDLDVDSFGYSASTPYIPALASVEAIQPIDRFYATYGEYGITIYDPEADRITDYEAFEAPYDWRTPRYNFEVMQDPRGWHLLYVSLGSYTNVYILDGNGKLSHSTSDTFVQGLFDYVGDGVFATVEARQTSGFVTMMLVRDQEVLDSTNIHPDEIALKIIAEGNRVFLRTDQNLQVYDIANNKLVRTDVYGGRVSDFQVDDNLLWLATEYGVELYLVTEASQLINVTDNSKHAARRIALSDDGLLSIVRTSEWPLSLFEFTANGLVEHGSIPVHGDMEGGFFHDGKFVLAQEYAGIAELEVVHLTRQLYLPFTSH